MRRGLRTFVIMLLQEWTAALQNERRGQRRAAPAVGRDDRLVSYDDIWGAAYSNG